MRRPQYADLADLPEDERITAIRMAVERGFTVAFVVEDDPKADRYLRKLLEQGLLVKVLSRGRGPVLGTVYVKVGPT